MGISLQELAGGALQEKADQACSGHAEYAGPEHAMEEQAQNQYLPVL